MSERVRIVGSYLSPYVRKVLVCLDIKGIPCEIDPIVPFFGNDEFARLSPVRRVPVLIDDAVTLADSTVICEYLEERHPEPTPFEELLLRTPPSRHREALREAGAPVSAVTLGTATPRRSVLAT